MSALEMAHRAGSGSTQVKHDHNDQYLTFIMDNEEYGVDILSVQEIRGWDCATMIPNAPRYVKGVINLRGTIVPIVDLRQRFNLPQIDYSPTTVVIVLKINATGKDKIVGIVVDAVSDVYSLPKDDMKAPPDITEHPNSNFIRGLASVGKKMVILLNLENLIAIDRVDQYAVNPE